MRVTVLHITLFIILLNALVLSSVLYNYWQYRSALLEIKTETVHTLQEAKKIATHLNELTGMAVMENVADKISKTAEWFKK